MMQLENQHGTNPPIDFDITRIIANLEEHVQKFTAPGLTAYYTHKCGLLGP
jgi:hypothetical protein